MSSYLSSLVARTTETGQILQPRLPSVYEPTTGGQPLPVFAPKIEPVNATVPSQSGSELDKQLPVNDAALHHSPVDQAKPPDSTHDSTDLSPPSVIHPQPSSSMPQSTVSLRLPQPEPSPLIPDRPKKASQPEETAAKIPLQPPETKAVPVTTIAKLQGEREPPQKIVIERLEKEQVITNEKSREMSSIEKPIMYSRRTSPPPPVPTEPAHHIQVESQRPLGRDPLKPPNSPISIPQLEMPTLLVTRHRDDEAKPQVRLIERPILVQEPSVLPTLRPKPTEKSGQQITPVMNGKQPQNGQPLLLKPEPQIQVVAPRLLNFEPEQPSDVAAEPGPTVEVRIGRIEVRATPPNERKPRPKSNTAVMNLDDYLKQRNGQEGKRR